MISYYISEFPSKPDTFLLYGRDIRLAHIINKNYYCNTHIQYDNPLDDEDILNQSTHNVIQIKQDDTRLINHSMLDMPHSEQNIGNHIEIQYNATVENIVVNGEIDINKDDMALIPSLNNNTLYYYDFNHMKCINTLRLNKECQVVKWNKIDPYKFAIGLYGSNSTNSLYFYDIIPDDYRFISKSADIREIVDDISWLLNDINCLVSGNNASYLQFHDIRIKSNASIYNTKSTFGLNFINNFTFLSHTKNLPSASFYNNNNNNGIYPIVQYWDIRMMNKCLKKHIVDDYIDRIKFNNRVICYKQNDGILFYNYHYNNNDNNIDNNLLLYKPKTKLQYKINNCEINDYLLVDSNILMCVNKKGELTTMTLHGNIDIDFSTINGCVIPSSNSFINVDSINSIESTMYNRAKNKYNNFITGDIHPTIIDNDKNLYEFWKWIYYISTKDTYITNLYIDLSTNNHSNDDDNNILQYNNSPLDQSKSIIFNDSYANLMDNSLKRNKKDRYSISSNISYNKLKTTTVIVDNDTKYVFSSLDSLNKYNEFDSPITSSNNNMDIKLLKPHQQISYPIDLFFDPSILSNNKIYNYWLDDKTITKSIANNNTIKKSIKSYLLESTTRVNNLNRANLIRPFYSNPMRLKLLSIFGWLITTTHNDDTFILNIDDEIKNMNQSCFRNIALLVLSNKVQDAIDYLLQHKDDPICMIISLALSQYDSNTFTSSWFKCIDHLRKDYKNQPYLNFIISFISIDKDLLDILCKSDISYFDKITTALLYLNETQLHTFIKRFKQSCTCALYKMIPLGIFSFQKYIKEYFYNSNDLQTVALLTLTLSRVIHFKSPLLNDYILCYRDFCNKWKLWKERCYLDLYIKKYKIFENNDLNNNKGDLNPFNNYQNLVKIVCNYCHHPLVFNNKLEKTTTCSNIQNTISCANCGKPLPKCCICQLAVTQWPTQMKSSENTHLKGAFCWCPKCRHVSHAAHISDWFKQFDVCPVNGCKCKCRLGTP